MMAIILRAKSFLVPIRRRLRRLRLALRPSMSNFCMSFMACFTLLAIAISRTRRRARCVRLRIDTCGNSKLACHGGLRCDCDCPALDCDREPADCLPDGDRGPLASFVFAARSGADLREAQCPGSVR